MSRAFAKLFPPPARRRAPENDHHRDPDDESRVVVDLSQGVRGVVDASDWEVMRAYRWYAFVSRPGPMAPDGWSARWVMCCTLRKGRKALAHRLVAALAGWAGQVVDHATHHPVVRRLVDNSRGNLRPASVSQNNANARRRDTAASGFHGVQQLPSGRWRALISVEGRSVHVGTFDTAELAARAYDGEAADLFGEYATLNFPDDLIPF